MRASSVLAISAVLGLACSDPTGISVQGPSFLRARVDGAPLAFDDNDSFLWTVNGTTLVIQVVPGTLRPGDNQVIGFQVGHYQGPGTYTLEVTADPGPVTDGWYGVVDSVGGPRASYATVNGSTGVLRIISADTTVGAIVGTFEFSAASFASTRVVHITGGSFRIRH